MDGKKLKEFLSIQGISLTEVAKRLGMSQQALSSLLSSNNVKSGTVEMICDAVGKSPAVLYPADNSGTAVVGTANQSTVIGKQDNGVTAVKVLEKQLDIKDKQIETLMDIILKK
jgi:transcriptional regulator with XRE-family HTH domain